MACLTQRAAGICVRASSQPAIIQERDAEHQKLPPALCLNGTARGSATFIKYFDSKSLKFVLQLEITFDIHRIVLQLHLDPEKALTTNHQTGDLRESTNSRCEQLYQQYPLLDAFMSTGVASRWRIQIRRTQHTALRRSRSLSKHLADGLTCQFTVSLARCEPCFPDLATMNSKATRPSWGVSGGAMLRSQVPEGTVDFHQTLRPFEQTMRPSQQSMRLSQQVKPRTRQSVDFSKEIRPTQQRPRQSLQVPAKESRPSQRIQQRPSLQPSLKEYRSSERIQQQRRRSSKPRQPSQASPQPPQPLDQTIAPRRGLRLSELATDQKSKKTSGRQFNTRPSLEVSLGLPRQNGSDKTAASSVSQGRLSSAQRREIMERVSASVKNVMSSMLPGDKNNELWKSKFQRKNIAYHVDETSVNPGQTRFCCVSHTHATVDEIMSLFIPTDVDSVLHNNKLIFENLMDAKIVSVLRRPTKERPMSSMYLRYSSFQTSGPLTNRDMCVAVATDMFRQPDGSTIGYCLWDSVDDLELLKAIKQPGFDAITMFRSGFFFRHSGRRESTSGDSVKGQTKMIYMVGMESGARTSGLTGRLHMEKHGSTLDRLRSHFRRKYLDPSTFVMKTQWESKCSSKSCKQCDKPFQVLSNRVNCHACGHVVCRSCVLKESVEVHTIGRVPIHVCFWCLEKAGLPAPSSARKTRTSLRQRRHDSETASTFRQTISVVYTDVASDEDDDGEWAITTMGVPVRPSRMAAYV